MRLWTWEHLVDPKRATEARLIGPFPPLHELIEQRLDLHHGAAERASAKGEETQEYRHHAFIVRSRWLLGIGIGHGGEGTRPRT